MLKKIPNLKSQDPKKIAKFKSQEPNKNVKIQIPGS